MLVSCIGSVLLPHYFDWNTEQSMTLRLVTALVLSVVSIRLCGIFPRKVLSLNRGEQFLYIWLTAIGCLCLLSGQPSAEPLFSAGLIGSLFLLLKYCFNETTIRRLFIPLVAAGCCEAAYGLLQNKSVLGAQGHFDNPAGFAATMVALLPFAILLIRETGTLNRTVGISGTLLFITAIIVSESRAGIVAAITIGLLSLPRGLFRRFCRRIRIVSDAFLLFFLIACTVLLYQNKKDSADGRLLIWQCSWNMIRDRPLLGHGPNGFTAKYMLYQADYFAEKPDSRLAPLADNTKHPFNEYLGCAVSFGLLGILLLGGLFIAMLLISPKKTPYKKTGLTSIAAIAVLALFSYPLHYTIMLCFLTLDLFLVTGKEKTPERRIPIRIIRLSVIPFALFSISTTVRRIKSEIHWNKSKQTILAEANSRGYDDLYSDLGGEPLFLYNYGAVLNRIGKYRQSRLILTKCEKQFNDCDLQIIQADNYFRIGNYKQAEIHAKLASNMCPNRFVPLYQLVEIYNKTAREEEAVSLARHMIDMKVKVPSETVFLIRYRIGKLLEKGE